MYSRWKLEPLYHNTISACNSKRTRHAGSYKLHPRTFLLKLKEIILSYECFNHIIDYGSPIEKYRLRQRDPKLCKYSTVTATLLMIPTIFREIRR